MYYKKHNSLLSNGERISFMFNYIGKVNQSISKRWMNLKANWNYHIDKKLEAFGIVEIILILVIIVGLVLIFKGEIETIVNDAIDSIRGKAGKIV